MLYAKSLVEFSNLSVMKFVPAYDTILFGSPYSEKIILHICIRLSVLNPFAHFIT